MKLSKPALALTLLMAGAASGHAETACNGAAELRTYYERFVFDLNPSRCDNGTGPCTQTLKGWLFVPPKSALKDSRKPPILVYNHGSEDMAESQGAKCDIGKEFQSRGYVVFVPHRRGHGKSTGVYFDEWCAGAADYSQCKMDYLKMQVDDVKEAINYAKTLKVHQGTLTVVDKPLITDDTSPIFKPVGGNSVLPLIDPARVAIAGHSYGGITTMFANMEDLGHRAAVNIAGASQSWEGQSAAREEMKKAARKAVKPVFYLEPMNDKSIEPTYKLAWEAANACRVFQAAIFGAVDATGDGKVDIEDYTSDPDPSDAEMIRDVAHGMFTSTYVKTWAPAADEFMMRYLNTPAAAFDKLCQGTSIVISD